MLWPKSFRLSPEPQNWGTGMAMMPWMKWMKISTHPRSSQSRNTGRRRGWQFLCLTQLTQAAMSDGDIWSCLKGMGPINRSLWMEKMRLSIGSKIAFQASQISRHLWLFLSLGWLLMSEQTCLFFVVLFPPLCVQCSHGSISLERIVGLSFSEEWCRDFGQANQSYYNITATLSTLW